MNNKTFPETHELLKTAHDWMEAHRDEDFADLCKNSECKEIMKFLSQSKYRDITDEETAELIIINFPEFMDKLTADRLRFERMVERESKEITEIVLSSLEPVQKKNRFFEGLMSLILCIVIVILAVFVVVNIYENRYDQATLNAVLGLVALFFLDVYNR
jgi:hypothetical protein